MKYVSVLGDSISTFSGYNPEGYSVYFTKEMQIANKLDSVDDTWWARVIHAFGLQLCANASYSGSRISGVQFPAATSGRRIQDLRKDRCSPDLILVFMGINDFGYGVPVTFPKRLLHKTDLMCFRDAYHELLRKLGKAYPNAQIVCGTLMRGRLSDDEDWRFPESNGVCRLEDYNDVIRHAAGKKQYLLADTANTGIRYETLDGGHPTKTGHMEIAAAWIRCLVKTGVIKPSLEMCIRINRITKSADMKHLLFRCLMEEPVMIPVDTDGSGTISCITFEEQKLLPVFFSEEETQSYYPDQTRCVKMRDYIQEILARNAGIVLNPFSEPEKQYLLEYEDLRQLVNS